MIAVTVALCKRTEQSPEKNSSDDQVKGNSPVAGSS